MFGVDWTVSSEAGGNFDNAMSANSAKSDMSDMNAKSGKRGRKAEAYRKWMRASIAGLNYWFGIATESLTQRAQGAQRKEKNSTTES